MVYRIKNNIIFNRVFNRKEILTKMDKVKHFFRNGGKVVAFWSFILTLLIWLIKVSLAMGSYKEKVDTIEKKITNIDIIQRDIAELKTNQERILEILQGKYK